MQHIWLPLTGHKYRLLCHRHHRPVGMATACAVSPGCVVLYHQWLPAHSASPQDTIGYHITLIYVHVQCNKCIHVDTYIHTRTVSHTHMHARTHTHARTHARTHTHAHTHTHAPAHLHPCTHILYMHDVGYACTYLANEV